MELCFLGIEQNVSSYSFFVLISKEWERYTTNINQLVTNFVPPPQFLYSVFILILDCFLALPIRYIFSSQKTVAGEPLSMDPTLQQAPGYLMAPGSLPGIALPGSQDLIHEGTLLSMRG